MKTGRIEKPELTILELRELAFLGAPARIAELQAEIDKIRAEFPTLSKPGAGQEVLEKLRREHAHPEEENPGVPRRKHHMQSPTHGKAASERMRAHWAKRKTARKK